MKTTKILRKIAAVPFWATAQILGLLGVMVGVLALAVGSVGGLIDGEDEEY